MASIEYAELVLGLRREHGAELVLYVFENIMEGRESLAGLRRAMRRYLGRYPTASQACAALCSVERLPVAVAPYDEWLWRHAGRALRMEDGSWAVWRK